jgi:hypothetical protein
MTSGIFQGIFKLMPQEAVDPEALGTKISKIRNPELKEQALGSLLEWLLSLVLLEMVRTWQFGITFSDSEQAQSFYRIMISSYIIPMIVDLGTLCRAHTEIAQDTLTRLFSRYAENSHKAGTELEGIDPAFFGTKRKGTK